MLKEWDGSPYVQAIGRNIAVFQKQQNLAKRLNKVQLNNIGIRWLSGRARIPSSSRRAWKAVESVR